MVGYQIKQAWQSLKLKPGFVFTVSGSLGLTLGALLCVFTLLYVLIYKPLPYPNDNQLIKVEYLQYDADGQHNTTAFSYQSLLHLYSQHQVFEQAALVRYDQQVLQSNVKFPVVNTAFVTPDWFDILGINMHLGRGFNTSESLDKHNPVAVISYATWQSEFQLSPDVLQQKIRIGDTSFSIIGVTAEHFIEPQMIESRRTTQYWLPWDFNTVSEEARPFWWSRYTFGHVLAKLPAEQSLALAQEQLSYLADSKWQDNIDRNGFFKGWHIEIELTPLKQVIVGDSGQSTLLLLLAVAGLLVIACINIANLFVARTLSRRKFLAISAAIGAQRKHIFQLLFAESVLLMFFALVIAIGVAVLSFPLIDKVFVNALPRVEELAVAPITFLAGIAVTLLLAVAFAKSNQALVSYNKLTHDLKLGNKGGSVQVAKKLTQGMTVIQISFALSLMMASLAALHTSIDHINRALSWNVDNRYELQLVLDQATNSNRQQRDTVLAEVVSSLTELPQVAHISRTRSPLNEELISWSLTDVSVMKTITPLGKIVDDQYFNVSEQALLVGESFNKAHFADDADVLIINDVLAKQMLADKSDNIADVLGRELSFNPTDPKASMAVIGVVKSRILPGKTSAQPKVFRVRKGGLNMMIGFKPKQIMSRTDMLSTLKTIHSGLNIMSYEALSEQRQGKLFNQITVLVTSIVITGMTLFLSMAGLFGILSYATQLRQVEIATRLALGATSKKLTFAMLKEQASLFVIGLLLSTVLFFIIWQTLPKVTVNIEPVDHLVTTVFAVALVFLLAIVSGYLPLRKYLQQPINLTLRGQN